MIWYFCTFQNGHYAKSSYNMSPYKDMEYESLKERVEMPAASSLVQWHLLSYTWLWISECRSASLSRCELLEERPRTVSQSLRRPSGPVPSARSGDTWWQLLRIFLGNSQRKIGRQANNQVRFGFWGFPQVPAKLSEQVVASPSGILWLSRGKKWCRRKGNSTDRGCANRRAVVL